MYNKKLAKKIGEIKEKCNKEDNYKITKDEFLFLKEHLLWMYVQIYLIGDKSDSMTEKKYKKEITNAKKAFNNINKYKMLSKHRPSYSSDITNSIKFTPEYKVFLNDRIHVCIIELNESDKIINECCMECGNGTEFYRNAIKIITNQILKGYDKSKYILLYKKNHSICASPNRKDYKMIDKMNEVYKILNINIEDYIITTDFDSWSYKQELKERRRKR